MARLDLEKMSEAEWIAEIERPMPNAGPRAQQVAASKLDDEEMALFRAATVTLNG